MSLGCAADTGRVTQIIRKSVVAVIHLVVRGLHQFRVVVVIDFPDYSEDELIEITERIGESRGLDFDQDALEKARILFRGEKLKVGFGNAREVENVIDAAQRNLTLRISHLGNLATEIESHRVTAVDIPDMTDGPAKKQIGFIRNN